MKFSESFIEGEYLKRCSKQEKQSYKLKSDDEKRKVLSKFVEDNPEIMDDVSKNKKGCFAFLGIIVVLIIIVIISVNIFAKDKNENKDEDKKEDITHTKQNGYDVYERDGGMPLSENSSVKHFSMEMSDKLKKDHKNINEGVVFKDVMDFEDKKGNESKMVAVVVYISKDSIDEINFKNWPKRPESLYDVADGVVFHTYINDNDVAETRDQDEIPQEFYDMLGEEK